METNRWTTYDGNVYKTVDSKQQKLYIYCKVIKRQLVNKIQNQQQCAYPLGYDADH